MRRPRQPAIPDYSSVTAIEGQAFRSEGNGPLPWSSLQTELAKRTPGKNFTVEPSAKQGIEAVRLGAFAPPGSPLDRQTVMIFPLKHE
jgi:hypothetical protein